MDPSSISSTVCKLKGQVQPSRFLKQEDSVTSLYNYVIGLGNVRTKIYIGAEMRPNCLNKGVDLTNVDCRNVLRDGTYGDQPAQYIGPRLGDDGKQRNVFPLNEKVDTSVWKADEDRVYNHLTTKKSFLHATLEYGIEYDREHNKLSRPSKIYYVFKLFDDDKLVGQPIEGMVENKTQE